MRGSYEFGSVRFPSVRLGIYNEENMIVIQRIQTLNGMYDVKRRPFVTCKYSHAFSGSLCTRGILELVVDVISPTIPLGVGFHGFEPMTTCPRQHWLLPDVI